MMSPDIESSESNYRVVDALYRLHRDLFAIESLLIKNSTHKVKLAQLTTNGRMGALVAGAFLAVPILVAIADIKWLSAPAIAIYVIAVGVLVLWGYQIYSGQLLESELGNLAAETSAASLMMSDDAVFEEVNANAVRCRMIEVILARLSDRLLIEPDPNIAKAISTKIDRYNEILTDCCDRVVHIAVGSAGMVKSGARTQADHDALLDWCAAIPDFPSRLQAHPPVP